MDKDFLRTTKRINHSQIKSLHLFQQTWNHHIGTLLNQGPLDHMEIMDSVLEPTLTDLNSMVDEILNGTITAKNVKHQLVHIDVNDLRSELSTLINFFNLRPTNQESIIHKIKCVLDISKCLETTESIFHVSRELKLSGDFETVRKIQEQVMYSCITCH